MQNTNDIERGVRELLSQITLNPASFSSPAEENLQKLGLDSVGIIEFIYALEERFQIKIAEDDVLPETFESIESVTRLITGKNGTD